LPASQPLTAETRNSKHLGQKHYFKFLERNACSAKFTCPQFGEKHSRAAFHAIAAVSTQNQAKYSQTTSHKVFVTDIITQKATALGNCLIHEPPPNF